MFEGYGQLDKIHVDYVKIDGRFGMVAYYDLFKGTGDGFRLVSLSRKNISERTLEILSEGRLYARADDLRRLSRPLSTIGKFELLDLVEVEELPLNAIARYTLFDFPNNKGRRKIVTGYKLEHDVYSYDGRVVVKRGKMRKVEGDYLIGQARKGRKFYARKADLS